MKIRPFCAIAPVVAAVVCLMHVVPVRAEVRKLTLPEAVEYAVQHNGDLNVFRQEKDILGSGKVRAGLLPNPTLEVEGVTGALTGSRDENSMTLGVSQELFLSGKREKRLFIAELELEVYRWQLAERERTLREEVKIAFCDGLLAQQRVALAERAIALNRQLLDVARERLAAGDIPELEMNLVRVELARSEGARIEIAKTMLQGRSRLWKLLGLTSGAKPALSGGLEATAVMTMTLDELKQLANIHRPDLKALEVERDRGDAEVGLAQAERIPNLTTGLFFSHQERTDNTGAGEVKVRDNVLGLRISLPLPLFDRNQAGLQEARARRSASASRLTAALGKVAMDVEAAYVGYQDATAVLALYRADILPQFEENLKLTQEAYRLGEVGILTVIQEQKKFFEINDGYLTALHDRQTALVRLETAVATELTGGRQ